MNIIRNTIRDLSTQKYRLTNTAMATKIEEVVKVALSIFGKKSSVISETVHLQHAETLKHLLGKVTAKDVNFDMNRVLAKDILQGEEVDKSKVTAPSVYIELFENEHMTLSIFVLKKGTKIPLHDHPGMYGIIRVLHGQVSIQSYTEVPKEYESKFVKPDTRAKLVLVDKLPEVTLSSEDEATMLQPSSGNIHEIQSINGPAAILDLLMPPYDVHGSRDCHYFKEYASAGSSKYWLGQTSTPRDFYCDHYPYEGPDLNRFYSH